MKETRRRFHYDESRKIFSFLLRKENKGIFCRKTKGATKSTQDCHSRCKDRRTIQDKRNIYKTHFSSSFLPIPLPSFFSNVLLPRRLLHPRRLHLRRTHRYPYPPVQCRHAWSNPRLRLDPASRSPSPIVVDQADWCHDWIGQVHYPPRETTTFAQDAYRSDGRNQMLGWIVLGARRQLPLRCWRGWHDCPPLPVRRHHRSQPNPTLRPTSNPHHPWLADWIDSSHRTGDGSYSNRRHRRFVWRLSLRRDSKHPGRWIPPSPRSAIRLPVRSHPGWWERAQPGRRFRSRFRFVFRSFFSSIHFLIVSFHRASRVVMSARNRGSQQHVFFPHRHQQPIRIRRPRPFRRNEATTTRRRYSHCQSMGSSLPSPSRDSRLTFALFFRLMESPSLARTPPSPETPSSTLRTERLSSSALLDLSSTPTRSSPKLETRWEVST